MTDKINFVSEEEINQSIKIITDEFFSNFTTIPVTIEMLLKGDFGQMTNIQKEKVQRMKYFLEKIQSQISQINPEEILSSMQSTSSSNIKIENDVYEKLGVQSMLKYIEEQFSSEFRKDFQSMLETQFTELTYSDMVNTIKDIFDENISRVLIKKIDLEIRNTIE